MGCCNKTINGEPIGRVRYWTGAAFVASAHLGILGAVGMASIFRRHYRRVLPFYVDFTRATLLGIWRRERITVGETALADQTCDIEGVGEGPR